VSADKPLGLATRPPPTPALNTACWKIEPIGLVSAISDTTPPERLRAMMTPKKRPSTKLTIANSGTVTRGTLPSDAAIATKTHHAGAPTSAPSLESLENKKR
jgi:hypothetical protein